ncbi:MAG: formylglycine-generating enzyme family protein [Salibacteraceae bacterium]
MKIILNKYLPIICLSILLLSGKKKSTEPLFDIITFEKSFVFIPSDTLTYYNYHEVRAVERNFEKKADTLLKSFYLCDHEVTNGEYLFFLMNMKKENQKLYESMLPDTMVWEEFFSNCQPLIINYLRSERFRKYPVVGVSYFQANYYLKWLTNFYSNFSDAKFKDAKFSLPLNVEWSLAYSGASKFNEFPWHGPFIEKDKRGNWPANFWEVPQHSIYFQKDSVGANASKAWRVGQLSVTGERSAFSFSEVPTKPVKSYKAYHGHYDMAGNVEEMVLEQGVTKGGSWMTPGFSLKRHSTGNYQGLHSSSRTRGFRVKMTVKSTTP